MDTGQILRDLDALPPDAQELVAEFVALLRRRYSEPATMAAATLPPIQEEPFVGMWRDRTDIADSTAWVRSVRANEWG